MDLITKASTTTVKHVLDISFNWIYFRGIHMWTEQDVRSTAGQEAPAHSQPVHAVLPCRAALHLESTNSQQPGLWGKTRITTVRNCLRIHTHTQYIWHLCFFEYGYANSFYILSTWAHMWVKFQNLICSCCWSAVLVVTYLSERPVADSRQQLLQLCSLALCWSAWPQQYLPEGECPCCSTARQDAQTGETKQR